jgi:hypothetical protein
MISSLTAAESINWSVAVFEKEFKVRDAFNRVLKPGDTVLIPCRIIDVSPTPDYCNVSVETLGGRSPDGNKDRFSAINTKQLIRANKGDATAFTVLNDSGKDYLGPDRETLSISASEVGRLEDVLPTSEVGRRVPPDSQLKDVLPL